MKMKLNKIVALGILGLGVLGFGGSAVAGKYEITEEMLKKDELKAEKENSDFYTEKNKNKHIQHTGTDWYFEHRYGTPTKERQEKWLKYIEKDKPKIESWLSQKIPQEKLKQALKLTSPLNKNTNKTLSQEEIQALKIETQIIRQQFLNYLIYKPYGHGTLYQDKFRFLYNRSKDLIILMIDNKVKDKELLEMTLEYRKVLEEDFLQEHNREYNFHLMALNQTLTDNYPVFKQAEESGKGFSNIPEYKEARKEFKQRDDVKKFGIIEQHYKDTNNLLEKYIRVEVN
ncbi:hypothetical protein ACWIW6_08205 [Ursidibacter sp. B-7004-1]